MENVQYKESIWVPLFAYRYRWMGNKSMFWEKQRKKEWPWACPCLLETWFIYQNKQQASTFYVRDKLHKDWDIL